MGRREMHEKVFGWKTLKYVAIWSTWVRWKDNIKMDIKSRLDRKVWLRIRTTGELLATWY
jgi:hypothetical protein